MAINGCVTIIFFPPGTAPTDTYTAEDTLSLPDALPISSQEWVSEFENRAKDSAYLDVVVKIALRLRLFMKENNLSQKDLADKLNVSPQYINKILRAKSSNFTIETAVSYGNILGIKLIDVPECSNELYNNTLQEYFYTNFLVYSSLNNSNLTQTTKSESYELSFTF